MASSPSCCSTNRSTGWRTIASRARLQAGMSEARSPVRRASATSSAAARNSSRGSRPPGPARRPAARPAAPVAPRSSAIQPSSSRCRAAPRPAAELHAHGPVQDRLRDVELAAVHRDERGERGRRVRQQRPARWLDSSSDGGPGELGQRGGRRAGHRVVDALGHQLLGPGQQGRRPEPGRPGAAGRTRAAAARSTSRASSSAPVPISAGTAATAALPVEAAAHPAVELGAAGQHPAPGQHGRGAAVPARSASAGATSSGAESTRSAWVEREVEVAVQHGGLGAARGQSTAGARRPRTASASRAGGAARRVRPRRRPRRTPRRPGRRSRRRRPAAAGHGQHAAAAVELDLGQRPADLGAPAGACAARTASETSGMARRPARSSPAAAARSSSSSSREPRPAASGSPSSGASTSASSGAPSATASSSSATRRSSARRRRRSPRPAARTATGTAGVAARSVVRVPRPVRPRGVEQCADQPVGEPRRPERPLVHPAREPGHRTAAERARRARRHPVGVQRAEHDRSLRGREQGPEPGDRGTARPRPSRHDDRAPGSAARSRMRSTAASASRWASSTTSATPSGRSPAVGTTRRTSTPFTRQADVISRTVTDFPLPAGPTSPTSRGVSGLRRMSPTS